MSDYNRVIDNSSLLYELYYLSQSLTPVPSNTIPYFSDVIQTNIIGQAQLNVNVILLRKFHKTPLFLFSLIHQELPEYII